MKPVSSCDSVDDVVVERCAGVAGELVLRRGAHLDVIANGTFLISTANEASSRAMVSAGLQRVRAGGVDVLIGGLGMGYALDEALGSKACRRVVVAELEPTIVRWFREVGGDRAEALAEAEECGRAEIVVCDVAEYLAAHPNSFDLVSLDTDNGPEWLVRDENEGLYARQGIALTAATLRSGGIAVFWSPERYADFESRLRATFADVQLVPAVDVIDGVAHEYTMYVGLRREADTNTAVEWSAVVGGEGGTL